MREFIGGLSINRYLNYASSANPLRLGQCRERRQVSKEALLRAFAGKSQPSLIFVKLTIKDTRYIEPPFC
jgi:hypothetical protein